MVIFIEKFDSYFSYKMSYNITLHKTTDHEVIAFVKERFHNAVEIDILGIFEVYSSLQIWPPPKKNFSGAKLFRANDVISIQHML